MKSFRLLLATALACAAPLFAQPSAPPAYPPPSPEQLEVLVSPIALYPDPLISAILPAATAPGDLVLAARFVSANADPAAVDRQAWDESVKAVAHYPELIAWLDENLEWTQQLGSAFLDQPADVMNTIQRLRTEARAAGILVDTPQQRVIVQQEYVYIVPAQPDVIYVPTYDPQIFYSSRGLPRSRGAVSFSIAFSTGPWLAYEPDWGRRSIWIDRRRDWSRRDWRPAPATTVVASAERQQWRPTVNVAQRQRVTNTNTTINNTTINNTTRVEVARPAPFAATKGGGPRRAPTPSISTSATPPPPPAREPVLAPTGRISEPRAERSPRTETPPPPAPSERVERNRDDPREHRATLPSRPPTAAPTRELPPPPAKTPVATPPAPGKQAPPPQAQAQPPPPKGKAKGKDKDDEEEDEKSKKRGRDD